jgi:putative NADH-flavin reductase
MESSTAKKVKVALIGATGAIGKEIVKHAKKDQRIEELCLVVRKRLEEWKDEDFSCKLKVVQMENFDDMTSLKDQL